MSDGEGRLRDRIVRIGDREFLTRGAERRFFGDLYHLCMRVNWPAFFAGYVAVFLVVNTLFATLYFLGDAPIANARPGFEDLFYFSIETLATVGYGDMHPQTRFGHVVATFEIFTGMGLIAVMTGLVFARFSLPRARVLFADAPVVGQHDRKTTLMLRMANHRNNFIVGAGAKLWLTRIEETAEGHRMRRVRELALERPENPMFALTWTIFHTIDETSPLHGVDAASLERQEGTLVVTLSGLDESSGQIMHARRGYTHDALRWGHRYIDVITSDASGRTVIDYTRFHDTQPETS